MKKILTIALALTVGVFGTAHAQTAVPSSRVGWDQAAPTLADANAYTYKYYPDGSATAVNFTGVTCTGTASPFQCVVGFPAFAPGNHTMQITASNAAGESVKSTPFAFVFVVTPATPVNVGLR